MVCCIPKLILKAYIYIFIAQNLYYYKAFNSLE